MWVALFLTCASHMASDCSFGAKTDRIFVERATCEAFVDHASERLSRVFPVHGGFCVELEGEQA